LLEPNIAAFIRFNLVGSTIPWHERSNPHAPNDGFGHVSIDDMCPVARDQVITPHTWRLLALHFLSIWGQTASILFLGWEWSSLELLLLLHTGMCCRCLEE
jgi:hypothetical protein